MYADELRTCTLVHWWWKPLDEFLNLPRKKHDNQFKKNPSNKQITLTQAEHSFISQFTSQTRKSMTFTTLS